MPFETDEIGRAPVSARTEVRDEVWLLGQPPLRDYLDFVRESVEGGGDMEPRALCDEWRVANDHYYALERSEAGIADKAECLELPSAMRPLAEELAAHPHFRNTCDSLPVAFGMVELDRLIVYQPHVALPFVEALQARLTPAPDARELFRFCQPLERRDPPMTVRRVGERRYQFMSDSTDFRFHKAALLGPDQIGGARLLRPGRRGGRAGRRVRVELPERNPLGRPDAPAQRLPPGLRPARGGLHPRARR